MLIDLAVRAEAFRHAGPYPILAVSGEQGSAKTVLSKVLRALVDPNAAPVRTMPREERDLFIAAGHGHLLAFDNLSDLSPRISDALCRLASGGSFAIRRLYTDEAEMLFQAARPAILNGIEDVITRPDLAKQACGRARRPTFCASVPMPFGMTGRGGVRVGRNRPGRWPAGWLRRAQTSLRTLGIEIAFSREGRAGTRIIR